MKRTEELDLGVEELLALTPAHTPLLVTVNQAAALLSVSRTTIYELMWRKELDPVRIGRSVRLSLSQLEEFVRQQLVTPG